MLKFIIIGLALAVIAMLSPAFVADAGHNTGHCGGDYKDEAAPFSITVADGAVAHEVFIKSGTGSFPENPANDKCSLAVTADGTYNGFVVSGIGTQTVTVIETEDAPHAISHIEANNQVVSATPTPQEVTPSASPSPTSPPISTATPTPSPSTSPTPSDPTPILTPTVTPIPTTTITPTSTATPIPSAVSTSTPTPTPDTPTPTSLPALSPTPTSTNTSPIPPTPTGTSTQADPCFEDEPCWDCATMGNLICGPGGFPNTGGTPLAANVEIPLLVVMILGGISGGVLIALALFMSSRQD